MPVEPGGAAQSSTPGEGKDDDEDCCTDEHDHRAGRHSGVVAGIHPDKAGEDTNDGANREHSAEGVGKHACNDSGNDEHRGNEGHTDHGEGGEDGERQDDHEHRLDSAHAYARDVGDIGVEGGEEQGAVAEEYESRGEETHRNEADDLLGRDAENAAEEGIFERRSAGAELRE